MTIAFFPPLTSTSRAAEIWRGRSSDLRSATLFSRSRRAWATRSSVASGADLGALAVRRILEAAVDILGEGELTTRRGGSFFLEKEEDAKEVATETEHGAIEIAALFPSSSRKGTGLCTE